MAHPYASRWYAEALAGADAALSVPEWGSHVVTRPTADGAADAAGIYPMAVFGRGADMAAGLDRLQAAGLVSVVLTPDPLLHPAAVLARTFELCRPFKTHYLIDRAQGGYDPTKHHRAEIRRGHRRCRVEQVALSDTLDAWGGLYGGLVARHAITGVSAFSDRYFQALAGDPAVTAFAAFVDDACAAMALWFAAEGVVYNHLNAANASGYANGANYALYDAAIAHFAGQGVINLGGGAGAAGGSEGLATFKRGFANGETVAHLCGVVLDAGRYQALGGGGTPGDYFPAYRAPAPAPATAAA